MLYATHSLEETALAAPHTSNDRHEPAIWHLHVKVVDREWLFGRCHFCVVLGRRIWLLCLYVLLILLALVLAFFARRASIRLLNSDPLERGVLDTERDVEVGVDEVLILGEHLRLEEDLQALNGGLGVRERRQATGQEHEGLAEKREERQSSEDDGLRLLVAVGQSAVALTGSNDEWVAE